MVTALTLDIPPHLWVTSNHRLHWRVKAARVAQLRGIAAIHAARLPRPALPVHVWAVIGYPSARRADPANAEPTVKALLDGCVDARLIPDDDAATVEAVTFTRDPDRSPRGTYRVTLRFEEATA